MPPVEAAAPLLVAAWQLGHCSLQGHLTGYCQEGKGRRAVSAAVELSPNFCTLRPPSLVSLQAAGSRLLSQDNTFVLTFASICLLEFTHRILYFEYFAAYLFSGAPIQDLEFGTFLKKAPQRQNLGLFWDHFHTLLGLLVVIFIKMSQNLQKAKKALKTV